MFDSQWMLANTRGMYQYMSLLIQTYAYIAFCSYAFIDFHPWSYILNVQTSRRKSTDIFSIIVHVFCTFFLKNMPSIWANFNHVFEVFQVSIAKRCAGMRLADGGIQRLSSTPHFCLFFCLPVENLKDFISLDLLEPLDLCEPLDSFEFTLPLSLLLLMHEYFDEHLAFCAIFLSQKWTFFLKEQTWEPTFSNQSSYICFIVFLQLIVLMMYI